MSTIEETTKLAIEAVAKARVAEALGGDVIAKLVDEVMNHIDRQSYGTDKKRTFFDKIVRECMETTIRQAVNDAISSNEIFKAKISDAIRENADKFAVTILDALADGDWRVNMKVSFKDE